VQPEFGTRFLHRLDTLDMIWMGMGAQHHIDVTHSQIKGSQPLLDMLKQGPMPGIDQHPLGTVDQVAIAVVGRHGTPKNGFKTITNFHLLLL